MLILIVLIQKNEGGSSLFANSGGSGMFNARGTSSILTKATWTLATIFIVNCVIMATMASRGNKVTLITKRDTSQPTADQAPDTEGDNDDDDLPPQLASEHNVPVPPVSTNTPQQNTTPAEGAQPEKQSDHTAAQPPPSPVVKSSNTTAPAAPDNKKQ
jgi:protein translocase SecG subunit